MNSASYASYRAAMPPECFGEPDDEPRRAGPLHCDGCGRFVGQDRRVDDHPDSMFGPARFEILCPACAARTPLPPTEAEMREHERRTLEAYAKAMESHATEY